MSEYLFGLHSGHLTAAADQVAGRHGAWHVNHTEARGESCGWFACPNGGSQFAVAKAVMTDIDRAGGIESLRRSRNARETSSAGPITQMFEGR
jgi:hypothetical protein